MPGVPVMGSFLYIERLHDDDVHFASVVRDISRVDISFGAAIPVVRETEFREGKIVLLNVPRDPRYRLSLRVYTNDLSMAPSPRVEIYPLESEEMLRAFDLPWQRPPNPSPEFPRWPHYAEGHDVLADLTTVAGRLRIEITSTLPIWAFASVINNDTQQVSIITPE
jgi:hypothetical protein